VDYKLEGANSMNFSWQGQTVVSSTILRLDPTIRVLGDTAYAAYNMVLQRFGEGEFKLGKVSETRIFKRIEDRWVMIHFHRN